MEVSEAQENGGYCVLLPDGWMSVSYADSKLVLEQFNWKSLFSPSPFPSLPASLQRITLPIC